MEKVYINHVTWYMLQDQRTSCEYLTKTNVIYMPLYRIYEEWHTPQQAMAGVAVAYMFTYMLMCVVRDHLFLNGTVMVNSSHPYLRIYYHHNTYR